MPPVVTSILIGFIRLGLMPVTNWLVAKGIITGDQTTELIINITTFAAGALWIVWSKVKEHRILNTAIASAPGASLADVKAQVDAKVFASALTPADVKPVIKDNSEPK